MIIFGLTGGIASGKSTVSDMLAEMNCSIIDADVLARTVVEPGKAAWREVVKEFGVDILQEDGSINREKLGSIIFNSHERRHTLNRCTHPYIRRAVVREIVKNLLKGWPYVVLVSPLLFETKYALKYLRQTIVVSCTHSQQVSRLMGRDGVDEEQALKRIQAQIPLSSKCGWADVVIDNSHDRHSTRQQVEKLVESMNRLSSCRRFLYVAVLSTLVVLFTAIAICLCMNFKAMSTLF